MSQQIILCKIPVTRIVLTSANPAPEERKAMRENVKKGYLYIIPPEDDRYRLISYRETDSDIIYVLLSNQKNNCFGLCRDVYLAVSHRPGIYNMERA